MLRGVEGEGLGRGVRVDEAHGQLTNLRVLDEGLDASRLFEVPNLEGAVLGAGGELRERREKERMRENAREVGEGVRRCAKAREVGEGVRRRAKACEGVEHTHLAASG